MSSKPRPTTKTKGERALDEIYAEIPSIPSCDGSCASACGPIAMFKGEWERVKRAAGRTPRMARNSIDCPLLSPTGWCTVYTVRPYICRLWGTTRELACPRGCEPERWLSIEEAGDIFARIRELAGPEVDGPFAGVGDLWDAIALEARRTRSDLIEEIKRKVQDGQRSSTT